MPAADLMIPQVESALLLLTESVVVFVCRRVECCRDTIASVLLFLLIRVRHRGLGMVGNHEPTPHVKEHLSRSRCYRDGVLVGSSPGAPAKVMVSQGPIQIIERHGMRQEGLVHVVGREMNNQPRGAKNVAAVRILLMSPGSHRGRSHKTISRGCGRCCRGLAQRDSNDVRCVRFKKDCAAISLKNHPGALCMEYYPSKCREHNRGQHFPPILHESHLNPLLLLQQKAAHKCFESRNK